MNQKKNKATLAIAVAITTKSIFLVDQTIATNDVYASGPPGLGGSNTGTGPTGGCNTSHCHLITFKNLSVNPTSQNHNKHFLKIVKAITG